MAVLITNPNGKDEVFNDGEDGHHAYAVTDAGVLRVLKQQPGWAWFVLFDYSPSGWTRVQGTRYVENNLELLHGADGTTGTMDEAARSSAS